MSEKSRILVVDDTPQNVRLLDDMLTVEGYDVVTAASGPEALESINANQPDLVLLDIMMPGMNGYEVCKEIRSNPKTEMLPVVMVTALDQSVERVKGIEAGADDFLGKPVNDAELMARVKSLLRIKEYYDKVQSQTIELAELNKTLEKRVKDQVEHIEKMGQLKRFLPPNLAELILDEDEVDPLKPHRRDITVVFLDLRGFTAFTSESEPEEVMAVLNEFHSEMGKLIVEHEGTIDSFSGDGIMIIFNDPLPIPEPTAQAVKMVVAMRKEIENLKTGWQKNGYDLDCGFGIAQGYATIGGIGFEGRRDYSAIGSVPNLAARLCDKAKGGQILISQKNLGKIEDIVEAEAIDELNLKGFNHPVSTFNIIALK